MLKHRNPIITALLTLLAASACHRLPISLGDGFDDAFDDPSGSGSAGSSATGGRGGTGGAPGTETAGTGGVGGGPAFGECDASYVLCLESGELPEICRDVFSRCEVTGGTAGTGAGGYAGGTSAAGASGYGSGGAAPDGTGVGGTGGYAGGTAGASGLGECDTTYLLCLESGEHPEICRDELGRCELSETGAGGASGEAGTGNAENAGD